RIGFEDGANDSRFLSQFGIKGIVWGADGNRSQHTPNEHVNIESVYELYALLDTFIKRCDSAGKDLLKYDSIKMQEPLIW
ncbi:MAG: hypothetical protein KJ687_10215, partial [Proteobacteria bacterium]|nr:hypothetical protein [Pseudomonadota bacterium]